MTTFFGVPARRRHLLIGLALTGGLAVLVVWLLIPNAARDVRAIRAPAPLVAAHCPQTEAELQPWTSGDFSGIQAGAIASDFAPTTVMLCTVERDTTGTGLVGYTVTTSEGPASDDLVSALELPDQVFWFDDRGACTANLEIPPYVLLLDNEGRTSRPAIPLDPCAKTRPEVRAALDALPLVTTRRLTL